MTHEAPQAKLVAPGIWNEFRPGKEKRKKCGNGHDLVGRNFHRGRCRACNTARIWASRHNLFIDNPKVVEYADQQFKKIMEASE